MARTAVLTPPSTQASHSVATHWPHYSLAGATGALLFACASFTPSLVPRDFYLQGLVGGLSATVGYGLGVLLAWLGRAATDRRPSRAVTRRLWVALACAGVPLVGLTLWAGQRWQRQIHLLTGVRPPKGYAWLPILLVTLGVFLVLVAVGRALRWLVRRVTRQLRRLVPDRLARPLAVVIVAALLVGLNNGLIWRGVVTAANAMSGSLNGATSQGTLRPKTPERSGSPASLISWDSLGRKGRDFVGLGPSRAALTAFSGRPAKQPIRVYAGLKSAATARSRAALAVRDLRRAGGFDRAVVVVATTTGTGMVSEPAASAIEYMYNGDTAIVGLQYSYLPSVMSLLVDRDQAEESAGELFNQVYDAWAALPPHRRPLLLLTGTSLGVFGSEAAFGGLADVVNRTDGVVWAGPPSFSPLHRMLVQQRDPGSPEWLPVYDAGRTVRFAAAPHDLWRQGPRWDRPRVVYLQHGSDAVVRWSPGLVFDKPDWLSEPLPPDVSPDMVWIPAVTFWQVTADLPAMYGVPPEHGHRYRELYADAWAAVAPPKGWTAEDTRRLRDRLSTLGY